MVEQYEKEGVCDISKVKNGRFTSLHVGASDAEAITAIGDFLEEYFHKGGRNNGKNVPTHWTNN